MNVPRFYQLAFVMLILCGITAGLRAIGNPDALVILAITIGLPIIACSLLLLTFAQRVGERSRVLLLLNTALGLFLCEPVLRFALKIGQTPTVIQHVGFTPVIGTLCGIAVTIGFIAYAVHSLRAGTAQA